MANQSCGFGAVPTKSRSVYLLVEKVLVCVMDGIASITVEIILRRYFSKQLEWIKLFSDTSSGR